MLRCAPGSTRRLGQSALSFSLTMTGTVTMPRRGIGITTRNRRDVFNQCIEHWLKHRPDDCKIVVVDDGSDQPVPDIDGVTIIRHEHRKGVAASKNRCFAELEDCDHIWLSDDDAWSIADNWWEPYEQSHEPHICYGWPHKRRVPPRPGTGWPPQVVTEDERHHYYSFPRGVFLYFERRVLEKVGGMNVAHGAFSGEHVEHSGRIAEAFRTRPFPDLKGSHRLIYSRDKVEGNTHGSSFPLDERRRLHTANGAHWGRKWEGWPFFPYREGDTRIKDWSDGPFFEDLRGHVAGLHPHRVEYPDLQPHTDELQSGDYVILRDRDWWQQRADRHGWIAVGHNEQEWAIRVI